MTMRSSIKEDKQSQQSQHGLIPEREWDEKRVASEQIEDCPQDKCQRRQPNAVTEDKEKKNPGHPSHGRLEETLLVDKYCYIEEYRHEQNARDRQRIPVQQEAN
jgi:hypothetical protein